MTRILFVFDASQSMYGIWNKEEKIKTAKRVLTEMIDSLAMIPNVQLALRVYGHQSPVPPQDCNDTKLEVPFLPNNAAMIKQKINSLDPKGTTPIARSLELSAGDFPASINVRNIIILITDGIESCDGDPCAVSKALQEKGVVLRPFVIGLGYDTDFSKTFKCAGRVFNVANENQFQDVLKIAVSEALNNTTAQVNLLDTSKKPTETNVNMSFYNSLTGQLKYNFIHTMNEKNQPDTLILDPLMNYNLVIHTTPTVTKENFEVSPGKHSIISIDAPQGQIELKKPEGNYYQDLQFIVRKAGESNTLTVQGVNKAEKYLCGKYDIEILCLPRIIMNNIVVSQSLTTTLRIRQPGQAIIIKNTIGYGAIYHVNKNSLELVANLNPDSNTNETFILQPGNYKVVFRKKIATESLSTVEKNITIESNSIEQVKL
ncbi:MAG: VWA domain-containing protein [Bacteroidales bacterium]|nr:VWA domain-containing protein [Bacteroidales bacterium]